MYKYINMSENWSETTHDKKNAYILQKQDELYIYYV